MGGVGLKIENSFGGLVRLEKKLPFTSVNLKYQIANFG